MARHPIYTLLATAVLLLTALPVGIAVFVLGFVYGDSPCVMCWQQRIGMALIALNGLFILRYGPRPRYIGLATLTAAWGIHMGIRHSSLHLARDIGQGFSLEILGAHTYTWSVFIFWVCVVAMGLLLLWLRDDEATRAPGAFRPVESLAAGVLVIVIAGNVVQAFASTGPPPFMGQGDPVRFSFNPSRWVWSLDEWSPDIPVSLRGRWAAEKPDATGRDAAPANGPLAGSLPLRVIERRRLTLPLGGPVTDIAYNAASDRFVLTTAHGVYLADGLLTRVLRGTIVDPGFSVDLSRFAGCAFVDSRTVLAVSENKSFVVLRETDQVDARANWRYFLSAPDQFEHVARSRLTTVRARLMYVMAAAYDDTTNAVYTATVPNMKSKRLVVSRFDRRDMTLSAEFLPTIGPGTGLSLREARSLDDLYITGLAAGGGILYAVSAAHGTILAVDLTAQAVTGAWHVDGLVRPTGLAVKGDRFYVVSDTGDLAVIAR